MRGAAAAALLLLLLLPGAGAQVENQAGSCRPPILETPPAQRHYAPGDSFPLRFSVENANGPPVEGVRATITITAPAGWSAIATQRELTLRPGEQQFVTLDITAPNRGTGEPAGNITLLVTFVCVAGDVQTSASARQVFEVEVVPFQAPWALVLGAFLVLLAGVALLGVRRLRRGVALVATSGAKSIPPGGSAKYTMLVENRRGKPVRCQLLHAGLPAGWTLHLALEEIELEPGEEKALWAILKVPPDAAPGTEAHIALRLEGAPGGRESASATLRAKVAPEGS